MSSLKVSKDNDAVNEGCEKIDAKVYLKPDPKWMVVCSICSGDCFNNKLFIVTLMQKILEYCKTHKNGYISIQFILLTLQFEFPFIKIGTNTLFDRLFTEKRQLNLSLCS